ncbi:pentapeptide repeat-containing protein [Streptomyces caatingaensis]|uniref:Pentapeptide repeat-containing protein n=1 Tax=Streptomyces caatingaensis TaxID=1678637 RepID=A0A0K9XCN0_9ACTN|nr:pentapeptide repeat-containing protein [Streptomyces caatingaensis]KNB50988.1 pentapeptide repeat-containing protein [Streptomyces caatingaensis]
MRRVPEPRELADLPYAHRLEPFGGELERERSYEWVHVDGREFDEVDGGSAHFTESALSSVTFTRGRYRRTLFDGVWLHHLRAVGSDFAESRWLDVECGAGLLAGAEIHGAEMRRVVFHHCKFDSVNLRVAALREVDFVDCLLRDVDFGGATLTDVSFPGTTLERVDFARAKLSRVDLRGAVSLGIRSVEALKGAVISSPQLFDLAPALAQHVGLTVRDTD